MPGPPGGPIRKTMAHGEHGISDKSYYRQRIIAEAAAVYQAEQDFVFLRHPPERVFRGARIIKVNLFKEFPDVTARHQVRHGLFRPWQVCRDVRGNPDCIKVNAEVPQGFEAVALDGFCLRFIF